MTTQLHGAYSIPVEAIDVSDPQLYQDDTVSLFRAAAPRRAGALVPREPLRPLLVGVQVQGHHAGRGQPPDLLVRTWRDPDRKSAGRVCGVQLHPRGPTQA